MARRLGLAQALVNDPELLILDEPTSGLDPIGTRQVKDLILELGRRGKTILLTSHLLADVEDVCSRMVILYGGRIRAQGTAAELLADSRHTLIRAPRLDEKTIRAVDETLHRVQGVGIEGVSAPRQTLEELFLDIVERARAEHPATQRIGRKPREPRETDPGVHRVAQHPVEHQQAQPVGTRRCHPCRQGHEQQQQRGCG
jgi:ABC-2 type transport system ATP-binding protein